MARKYGWKKDPKDHRDWQFKHVLKELETTLPAFVDLRGQLSPVENQENIGSCVANAVVGALEFLELKSLKCWLRWWTKYRDLSRLFVYYNARQADGDVESDTGTTIRTAVKAVAQLGVCMEKTWPYDTTRWMDRPSDLAYKQAKVSEIKDYYRANAGTEVKQALALDFPVPFGATLFPSFENVGSDGKVPMPSGEPIGGHAMLIVGYDNLKQVYIVRNSWGTDWGDKGYCYFPYAYLENPQLADDFWVIRK